MGMNFSYKSKNMHNTQPISVIFLATLPDSGMKSLGSKSLFKLKDRTIIDYQLENIKAALKHRDYDITFVCGFDCNRVEKMLLTYTNKLPIRTIKQKHENLNFVGSFLEGLTHAKYNNVLSINYGCLFTKNVIRQIIKHSASNMVSIAKKHNHNENIDIGCYLEQEKIVNIFFNLGQYKYLDMNLWSANTIQYIKHNLLFDDYKNKFMFEIINELITCGHTFDYLNIEPNECMVMNDIKMLNKIKRIFFNANTISKKTKS